jgi:hypothetical protein
MAKLVAISKAPSKYPSLSGLPDLQTFKVWKSRTESLICLLNLVFDAQINQVVRGQQE